MKPSYLEIQTLAGAFALLCACTVGDDAGSFTGGSSPSGSSPTQATMTGTTDTGETDGTTAGTDTGVSGSDSDPTTTTSPTTDPVTSDPTTGTSDPTDPTTTTTNPTTTDPGPVCGNGMVEGGEVCDGADLGGQTCAGFGFDGGNLACTGTCMYDTSGCTNDPGAVCGDGVLDGGEACDGNQLGGKDCTDFGFDQGNLACTGNCSFDTSGCSNNNPMCQPQPNTGEYAHCLDPAECVGVTGCITLNDPPEDGVCSSVGCNSNADCTPVPAGCTATPTCYPNIFNGTDGACLLNCGGGKTCPVGMTCTAVNLMGTQNLCF